MEKIEIKSFFTGWHEVTRERAETHVRFLLEHVTTMRGQKLIDYIETNRLRGIKVKELLGE